MSTIAFLDDSFPFTGATLRQKPLGGVQSATVLLAEALAQKGHKVTVRGMAEKAETHEGVFYRPLAGKKETYDFVIANRAPKLLRHAAGRRRALWLHNPANYMRKPRHILPYFFYRPATVFIGEYHRATWLNWLPCFEPTVIPYGVGPPFTDAAPASTVPPPRAIFTSNPRRGLDWLLDIWSKRIRPAVPGAELHIFAGRSTYGGQADEKLDAALAYAGALADQGVVMREPVVKEQLVNELRQSRVMLYRGDSGETFCGSAAEAQAMGVPLVTAGVGSLYERVQDSATGFLRMDPGPFADAAIRLLKDDALWTQQHKAALAARAANTWEHCAAAWEKAFGL